MVFNRKVDIEAEKAKIKGLQSKISEQNIVKKRKMLEMKEKELRKQNSFFGSLGDKTAKTAKQVRSFGLFDAQLPKRVGSNKKKKPNMLDNFLG